MSINLNGQIVSRIEKTEGKAMFAKSDFELHGETVDEGSTNPPVSYDQ